MKMVPKYVSFFVSRCIFLFLLAASVQAELSAAESKFMKDFFASVEIIKQNILVIRNATKRIGDINQQVFCNYHAVMLYISKDNIYTWTF
jgi:hypothetical protein